LTIAIPPSVVGGWVVGSVQSSRREPLYIVCRPTKRTTTILHIVVQ